MPETGNLLLARDRILQFAFALFMVAIATYIRLLLTPTIHDGLPFGTYTLAVIIVAWVTGVWPAVLALIASTLKQNDTDIWIEVQDNKIGIPIAIREQVFTAFFQANLKQSRFAPGLGLGLSIVKKLVEFHGGHIEVASQGADNGSRFIVSLPSTVFVDNAVCQEGPSMPRAHEALPTIGACGRKAQGQIAAQAAELDPRAESKRILIVDDNHDTADSLSTLLRMDGFDTRIAHSGLDAIAAYHAYSPSVILLDIGLPEMSGYEVAIQLRQEASSHALKIIALSGWGAEADIKKGEAAGFDVHLIKPVRYGQLLSHI